MQRSAAAVHWVGLFAILLSLFSPMITSDAFAEGDVPEPEVTLLDEGTPVPEEPETPDTPPTTEPTPTPEPTAGPIQEPEPTAPPTVVPTAEPTAEPTLVAEPTSAPPQPKSITQSAVEVLAQENITVTISANPSTVLAGDEILIQVRVNSPNADVDRVQISLPDAPGMRWTALPTTGLSCDENFLCRLHSQLLVFDVLLTSPTTTDSCGTYDMGATAYGAQGESGASGTITVECPEPRLSVSVDGPSSQIPGGFVSYTVRIGNSGTAPATDVVLFMDLPATSNPWQIQFPPGPPPMTCTGAGFDPLTCQIPNIRVGSSVTLNVTTTVQTCGTLTVQAEITSHQTVANYPASTTVRCPLVSVAVNSPATAIHGSEITLAVWVTNSGDDVARDVIVTMDLPLPLKRVYGGTEKCSMPAPGEPLTCSISALGIGASTVLQPTFATSIDTCGSYEFTATLSGAPTGSIIPGTTTVLCPNVSIAASGSPSITPGQILSYDLIVTNSGGAQATDVEFTSALPVTDGFWWIASQPPGFPCAIDASTSTLTCENLTLAPWGGSATVRVQSATLADPSFCRDFAISASLTGAFEGSASFSTSATCEPNVDVHLSGPGSIAPGQALAYDLTVTNTGLAEAPNVSVIGDLPTTGGTWSIVSQTPGGACTIDAGTDTLSCGNIHFPAQTGSLAVRVQSATLAESRFCDGFTASVHVTSPQPKTASATTMVTCSPDLAIAMSGTEATTPGGPVTYTIDLTNSGIGRANGVSLESQLPDIGTTWMLDATPAGCAIDGTLLRCSGLEVAPDDGHLAITVSGTLGTDATLCAGFTTSARLTGAYTGSSTTVATQVDCHLALELAKTATVITPVNGEPRAVPPGEEVTGLDTGDQVTYHLTATNSGNVALTSVDLTDTAGPVDGCTPAVPATLAPGAHVTCSVILTITEAHVFAGSLTTTATAQSAQTQPVTASATVRTTDPAPAISLSKTAIAVGEEPGEGAVTGLVLGDTVTYELVAKNTGNITIRDVTITDPTSGVALGACAPAILLPGQTLRCEATYAITQPDVDRGSFTNTAEVAGTAANDAPVGATASATVRIAQNPSLKVEVAGSYEEPTDGAPLGTAAFTFTATNDGTVTLTGVTLGEKAEASLGLALACTVDGEAVAQPATISVGGTLACTATHTVTQPEMDAGAVGAAIQATSDQTGTVDAIATSLLPRNPAIAISVEATDVPDNGFDRDETVTYAIAVTNAGNVTLSGITVTDDDPRVEVSCAIPPLLPDDTVRCTATATIVQDDVEAGEYTHAFRASASAPEGTDPASVSASESVTVPTDNTPGITLRKQHGEADGLVPDSTITYTLTATNSGNVRLEAVAIVDDLPGLSPFTCTIDGQGVSQPVTLLRGQDLACIATYPVTQDDFDRGTLTNTATVTGTYKGVEVADTATVIIDARDARHPRIELAVAASPQSGIAAGTKVTYTFTIHNVGNVTLTNVTVSDDTLTGIDCGNGGNVISSLAPEAVAECRATYTITQPFIDAYVPGGDEDGSTWSLTTTGTVIAEPPADMDPAQVDAAATITIEGPRRATLALAKRVIAVQGETVEEGPVEGLVLGDEVTYELVATNAGTLTLNSVAIADLDDAATLDACDPATLAPGNTLRCEAKYEITQPDVDRGLFTNTAVATATAAGGASLTETASATVRIAQNPSLSVGATGTNLPPDDDAPLGSVAYTVKATNDGTVTLTGVTLGEASSGALGLALACTIDGETVEQPATIPVGGALACTATHVVTQPQMDAGNLATTIQADSDQTPPASTPVTVSLPREAAITLETDPVDVPERGFDRDDRAIFTLTLANDGNVTLRDLTVTDDRPGVEIACEGAGDTLPNVILALAYGQTATCTATTMVTQDDVELGSFTHTARVVATTPAGMEPATVAAGDTETLPTDNTPGIGLWKRYDETNTLATGNTITYTLTATNTGKVQLRDVLIVDESLPGLSSLSCTVDGDAVEQPVTLARGETYACTTTYEVTQGDFDRGSLTNTASVRGTYGSETVSATATTTLDDAGARDPKVELTTTASQRAGIIAGTEIAYTYEVRNAGNVTLRNLTVTDDTIEAADIDCGAGGNVIASLAPTDPVVQCTATHEITQAFIDAYAPEPGEVGWTLTTTARVRADAPAGMTPAQVEDTSSVSISGPRRVAIALVTTVTEVDGEAVAPDQPVTGLTVGQVVTFALVATNTGDVTLDAVQIADAALDELDCPGTAPVPLAPGQRHTCTGTLTITQGMIDTDPDRQIETQGEAIAADPQENPVSDASSIAVGLEAAVPALGLAIGVAPDTVAGLDPVTATLTLTNTGNVTLHQLAFLANDLFDVTLIVCDGEMTSLPVGGSLTCDVAFTITQPQLDAGGELVVPVRAGATSALVPAVFSGEASATVTMVQQPELEATLTVEGASSGYDLGNRVIFRAELRNTGNVTLRNIAVESDAGVDAACPGWESLAPGVTADCTLLHTITEDDITAGGFTTTATVGATAPDGTRLERELTAGVTTVAPAEALVVTQRAVMADDAAPVERVRLGDTFDYVFVVENTGNMTIAGVVIENTMLEEAGIAIPAVGDLAPGETATVTAAYTVTAADVEAGAIISEAIATGTSREDAPVVSDPASVTVIVAQHPGLAVTTEVDAPEGGAREGDTIGLTFTLVNTGDVTIRDVALTSDLPGLVWEDAARAGIRAFAQAGPDRLVGDLAPGASATIRATYTVTAADVSAGSIRLAVVATGVGPDGAIMSDPVDVAIAVAPPAPTPEPTAPSGGTPTSLVVTDLPATGTAVAPGHPLAGWLLAATAAFLGALAALAVRRRA